MAVVCSDSTRLKERVEPGKILKPTYRILLWTAGNSGDPLACHSRPLLRFSTRGTERRRSLRRKKDEAILRKVPFKNTVVLMRDDLSVIAKDFGSSHISEPR